MAEQTKTLTMTMLQWEWLIEQMCLSAISAPDDDRRTRAIKLLNSAILEASEFMVLDELAAHVHPDVINGFCDGVEELMKGVNATTP